MDTRDEIEDTPHIAPWRGALAVGIVSLAVYLLTLAPGVYPGSSARLVALCAGFEPRTAPWHPLWWLLARGVAQVPLGALAWRLNLTSALLSAASAALMFLWMARQLELQAYRDTIEQNLMRRTARLAAAVAACALALSAPVWSAATRLQFEPLSLLLLLGAANLLLVYTDRGRFKRLLLFAFLCGLGLLESPAFILLAPFFAVRLFQALWQQRQLTAGRLLALLALLLLGFSLCFFSAWHFVHSGAVEGPASASRVALSVWLGQLRLARHYLPPTGWLFVVLLSVVPWLTLESLIGRWLNEGGKTVMLALNLALTILVLLALFNLPGTSWHLAREIGRLPILEAVLTAIAAGYLFACWYIRLRERWLSSLKEDTPTADRETRKEIARQRTGNQFGMIVAWPLAGLVLLAGVLNLREASGRRGLFADRCARLIERQLDGRDWILSDSNLGLDSNLRLLAGHLGSNLRILDVARERDPWQIQLLQEMIAADPRLATHRVRLRNAARLGVVPFVQAWLSLDADAPSRLALLTLPDLLSEAGCTPVPHGLLFIGTRDRSKLDGAALLARHTLLWDELERLLPPAGARPDLLETQRASLLLHASMVANNLGVLLDDLAQPAAAGTAYARAMKIEARNLSATLNALELKRRQNAPPAEIAAAEEAARALLPKDRTLPPISTLSRFHGYLRTPQAFASLGTEWAKLGRGRLAEGDLRRALELSADTDRTAYLGGLAAIYSEGDEPSKSEAAFKQILATDPRNVMAIRGLLQLAIRQAQPETARQCLERARQVQLPDRYLRTQTALVELLEGKPDAARQRLQALADEKTDDLHVWALLATAMIQAGAAADVERVVLARMTSVTHNEPNFLVYLTRGLALKALGPEHAEAARNALSSALTLRPRQVDVLAYLLQLDSVLRDPAAAAAHAKLILRLQPDHAFANLMMGSLLVVQGDLEGAEDHLRRSVARQPSSSSWNDLAEVLRRRGNAVEAIDAARQAVALQDGNAAAWDTLASALLDAGKPDEAATAIGRALALQADHPALLLTAARIHARRGQRAAALEILTRLRASLKPGDEALKQQIETAWLELSPARP